VDQKFTGPFELVTLPGVGHFPQREAPEALIAHLLSFLSRERL
jgi:pimeloyl-ACP methyl ester carboxylesterase